MSYKNNRRNFQPINTNQVQKNIYDLSQYSNVVKFDIKPSEDLRNSLNYNNDDIKNDLGINNYA